MVGVIVAAVGCALAGCGGPSGPVVLSADSVEPAADYSNLSAFLAKAVDKRGWLRQEEFSKHADRLDDQLHILAVTGPTASPGLLPSREDRLAYWFNARTAWSVKLAMLADLPERLTRDWLDDRAFPLDGRRMTLVDVDAAILAEGGWRALVAAPGVEFQRAPIPRWVFTADSVESQIDEQFHRLIDDKERFIIDVSSRRIRVPPVLWQFRHQLISRHNAANAMRSTSLRTALLPLTHGSAHRRLQDAVGYACQGAATERRPAVIRPD